MTIETTTLHEQATSHAGRDAVRFGNDQDVHDGVQPRIVCDADDPRRPRFHADLGVWPKVFLSRCVEVAQSNRGEAVGKLWTCSCA